MNKTTSNYAFIDGQNLNAGVKALGWKLDHKKFREFLQKSFNVERAYMFVGYMEEHQDLYNALQESGFILVFKPLIRREDKEVKGNVDAELVLQTMVDIEKYNQAVIVSGDGDFAGLIRHLASQNKLCQVIIPNRERYSSLFDRLEQFDKAHVTYVNDLRNELAYRDRPRQQGGQSRRPVKK